MRVVLDLTVYLEGPSEAELGWLLDYYESICPPKRVAEYKIAEVQEWYPVSDPHLTESGRAAASAGERRPHLAPVRRRLQEGRAFEVTLWDGRAIDDPEGSWSFTCRRIHLRSTGLHAFARILVPLGSDPALLLAAARAVADSVALRSGHGGLAFTYDPWLKADAFDAIYARARRFWGVDVEDLNATLALTAEGMKSPSWITLVGKRFAELPEVAAGLESLRARADVVVEPRRHGTLLVAGARPVAGDQNAPDESLAPYFAIAKALEPVLLDRSPDFEGEKFIDNANTVGWMRRFLDPGGWR